MTTKEKICFLSLCEAYDYIDDKRFGTIRKLSVDSNSFVRIMVASVLVNFVNEDSKNILLMLSTDKKADVRLEAYDSLSVFISEEVATFLENRIKLEKSSEALSYAITSYADVCFGLSNDFKKRIAFLKEIKTSIYDDSCVLSWYYALYLLGRNCTIYDILPFLSNNNYHIVCQTVSVLYSIADKSNAQIINRALEMTYDRENTIAAKDSIMHCVDFIKKEYLGNDNSVLD